MRKVRRTRKTALVGLIRNGQRETAFLRDYSSDGVCLDGVRGVMAGDRLVLHCKGARIIVEVRWLRGQQAGMCFVPSLLQSEKARFLAAVSRGEQPAHASRIFGFSELV